MSNLANVFGASGFDSTAVEPAADFGALPLGNYLAQIIESEVKTTTAGTGTLLEAVFEIMDGPHARRKIWCNMNLANPSPKAAEIGQRLLSAICGAIGRTMPKDSAELHMQPMVIKLGYAEKKNPATGQYEVELGDDGLPRGNDVKTAKPASTYVPPPTQQQPAQQQAPQQTAGTVVGEAAPQQAPQQQAQVNSSAPPWGNKQ